MKKWLHGSVVLAEDELFSAIRGKRIAAMKAAMYYTGTKLDFA